MRRRRILETKAKIARLLEEPDLSRELRRELVRLSARGTILAGIEAALLRRIERERPKSC